MERIINSELKEAPDISNKIIGCQCPLDRIYRVKVMEKEQTF